MGKNNHFDFMAAANHSYQTVWENRGVLLRLAVLPFLIKMGCIATILLMGMEQDVLRHGLIMLPSYFAEGFFVAYVLRVLYGGGDLSHDVKQAHFYFQDILAAMILYVLIKVILAAFIGLTVEALPSDFGQTPQPEPSSQAFMAVMMLFAFMIWAFRFMWLYVPVAMGIPLPVFLKRIEGFSVSFPMFSCWLMCFLPLAMVTLMLSKVLLLGFPYVEGGDNQLSTLVIACFQGCMEIGILVVTSLAMAQGFKVLMERK